MVAVASEHNSGINIYLLKTDVNTAASFNQSMPVDIASRNVNLMGGCMGLANPGPEEISEDAALCLLLGHWGGEEI
jgi:hypothetical protein